MTTTIYFLYRMTVTYSISFPHPPRLPETAPVARVLFLKMMYFRGKIWYFVVLAMVLLTDDTVTDLIINVYRYTKNIGL